MAEDAARMKQYGYRENSNLVLASQGRQGRGDSKFSGEVQSLFGKTDGKRMGDMAKADDAGVKKRRKVDKKGGKADEIASSRAGAVDFSNGGVNMAAGFASAKYVPSTSQTSSSYSSLLESLRSVLSTSVSLEVVVEAASEVMEIVQDKDGDIAGMERQVYSILTGKSGAFKESGLWDRIRDSAKGCKDYVRNDDRKAVEEDAVGEEGVAILFDSEDEGDRDGEDGEGNYNNVLASDSDSSDEEETEALGDTVTSSGGGGGGGAGDSDAEEEESKINPADIDEHYIQRMLLPHYSNDSDVTKKISDDVLNFLEEGDERETENKLVVLLGFDKFNVVKKIMKNRWRIVFCIKLRRVESDGVAKDALLAEISKDARGLEVLEELNAKEDVKGLDKKKIKDRVKQAKEEAQKLKSINADKVKTTDVLDMDDAEVTGSEERKKNSSSLQVLDLDSLAFKNGSRTMTNESCKLPDKSWRVTKPGYEEVHVPAVRNIPGPGEKYVKISSLPKWARPAFKGMDTLNRLQSKMYEPAFNNCENLLLCAPTGAGKTNVACLSMLNILSQYRNPDGSFDLKAFKIVYVAPMKALVQEVVKNFGNRLSSYGITVKELSGDSSLTRQQIQDTQLIVTTPEKWDIITRKSDDRSYTQLVKLVIIDEIHLLHDDRGPVLESIVSRTIRQVEQTLEPVRIVGLSATLPNFIDVALFLRVKTETGLFFFDNSFRPVPLQQQYIGVTEKKALKRFQLMNKICYDKVKIQQEDSNQVLIFCHSRADCAKTAKALRDLAVENDDLEMFLRSDGASKEILSEEVDTVKNADLKDVLPYGFAIHHAGLAKEDRELVEDLFADKHLQVLVCTATLAWGVNLPAHTVIIKGTQMYNPEKGRWVELSPLDIMQMLGRAGRPQFDSEGEGIVITNHEELQYYLSLMNLQLPVESQLVKVLPNHLNAEVVLGSVQSIEDAVDWLSYSYLFVRMLKSPDVYGVDPVLRASDPTLKGHCRSLVHSAACLLEKSQLIRYDRRSGALQSTPLGRVSSHFYVSHESMAVYNQHLKPSMSDIELLRVFSMSGEFTQLHVREDEKLELAKLSQKVPVPVKESVEEGSAKVNILLQAFVSKLKLEGFALLADMCHVQQSAARIMRCLFEIAQKRGWAELARLTLDYSKMVSSRNWRSQSPLRQFKNVPEIVARKLERKDIEWNRYVDLNPADLGDLVGAPKMGKTLHTLVSQFPRLELAASVQPITRSMLKVELTITPDFTWDAKVHNFSQLFHVRVEDVNQEQILHQEAFVLKMSGADSQHFVSFSVPVMDPLPPNYFIRVVSDRWLHSESVIPVSFKNLILPSKLPPSTQLLDLQPLPITALPNKGIQSLYSPLFRFFNPIQTQTFHALFETDASALVCAPTGSGKTVCAEFAILRALSANAKAKIIYVVAKDEVVNLTAKAWKVRFGDIGISTAVLGGDPAEDKKVLKSSVNVVLSSVESFDKVSRLKSVTKVLASVSLIIFDELHLLGGSGGPTLEICISRMRRIVVGEETTTRFLGLSSSLANAKDVGDWMGVKSSNLFNFNPKVRPIPIEIYMQSFDIQNFSSRLLAMGKPLYNGIRRHCGDGGAAGRKPALVFVPSRRQAQLTAIDLMSYATSDGDGDGGFLKPGGDAALEETLSKVKEPALAQTLAAGIGFVHSGMDLSDRTKVEKLYKSGVIGALVCTHELCWGLDATASFVAILGTETFDGAEMRYVDYSISDILQMMGKAGRPSLDSVAKALILCHSPKKSYLRKLLFEPLPIESHIDGYLHDTFTTEICSKVIENQQEALDWLTWSFMYRRLSKNPVYYGLQGVSQNHLAEHLSDVVEAVLGDLEESKMIEIDEDSTDVAALNLGYIGSNYYLAYSTIELIAASVTAKTRTRGFVEILSAASEFSSLSMRQGEDKSLKILSRGLPYIPKGTTWNDPNTKALVLLQAHFERKAVSVDFKRDLDAVLEGSIKLIQAMVDVTATNYYLKAALEAMEVSQMVVQGMWKKDDVLKQIPHFSDDIISKAKSKGVTSPFDILELEDDVRGDILKDFSDDSIEMSEIAAFCNAFPSIEVAWEVIDSDDITSGDPFRVTVRLKREEDEEEDEDEDEEVGVVVSKAFPKKKLESWWVCLGDPKTNKLFAVKRTTLGDSAKVNLDAFAPEVGEFDLKLYLISDSYMGVDQEFDVKIKVLEGEEEDDDDEDGDEGSDAAMKE